MSHQCDPSCECRFHQPDRARPSTKITVDKEGIIYINGQRMGKAVERDGQFYMDIDKNLLLDKAPTG